MRGKLENGQVSGVETLLQGGIAGALGSRLAFGEDEALHHDRRGLRRRSAGPEQHLRQGAADQSRWIDSEGQSLHRMNGVNHAIYSYGRRDQHGLTIHPDTGRGACRRTWARAAAMR